MEDKPFRTIDQQIDLLEKRGVSFIDRDEARQFLATHGYYSVVNGYKSAFIDKNKSNRSVEVYREGIDFMHIEVLYLLDRALRRFYCARLGKNDERSFRDLVESLALVSTPEETSQFCMRIRSAIGLLSSKCIPEKIAEEVTGLMKIDAEYLDSKIIDTDHEEQ